MPVENLGPEEVVTTGKESMVADVASTLKEENVGAVVVSEDDEPIGIVTDRDVALAVADGDAGSRQVSEVMTEDPATLHEDDEAIEISRAIGEHNVRRFPVVDDDGKLSGIVTLDDLVATIGEQLDDVAETVEAQSPGYSP